jgi:hypothetical protein
MQQQLALLRQQAVDLIKRPSLDDPSTLARLAPIPAKLQQLERELQEIEDEKSRIKAFLDGLLHPSTPANLDNQVLKLRNTRREQKKIRIEIDLSLLGLAGGKKIISEHKASDSLISFLVFLYESKGISVLEKLSMFNVNRGVLVSKNPTVDYRYRSSVGEAEYQYQRIADSGFFALTQSATKEKIVDIRNAWQFLKLPNNAMKVAEADKYEA